MTSSSSSSSITPDRILFGSCNSHLHEQVLWPAIVRRDASAFCWAGDAIYADDFEPRQNMFQKKKVRQATPDKLRALYNMQLQHPGYQALIEPGNVTVLGTWDDHDYGTNNGDKRYEFKQQSAMEYMHFLSKSSPRTDFALMKQRAAAGKGLYGVHVLDFERPRGQQTLSTAESGLDPESNLTPVQLSDRSVAIFLLDCRYHKDPWRQGRAKFFPDYQADFLGKEQWEWFEAAIQRSTAKVNIIVQGLQVHPDRYFDGNLVEDWSRFPMAQHRLYQAVLNSNASAPILVSGDVHMSELLRKDCRKRAGSTQNDNHDSRVLLEFTTSGMTHSWGTCTCARPETSFMCRTPHIQRALTTGMHLAHINLAWTDTVYLPTVQEGAKSGYQYTLDLNFGEFEFDWENNKVITRILGKDPDKPPLLRSEWDFDLLSGIRPATPTGNVHATDFESVYQTLQQHGAGLHDWICVNHLGHPSFLLKLYGAMSSIGVAAILSLLPLVLPAIIAFVLLRRGNASGSRKK